MPRRQREARQALQFYPAGTTHSSRPFSADENKWEFVGQLLNNYPLAGRLLVENDGTPVEASQKGYRYLPRLGGEFCVNQRPIVSIFSVG